MQRNNLSILGLDHAGKTVIRNYLTSGNISPDVHPTLAVDISKYADENLFFMIVDFPGQPKLRTLWPAQFAYTKIILFVIDVSAPDRFEAAEKELLNLLDNDLLDKIPIIFLFHKMDKPEAIANLAKAKEYFDIGSITGRNVFYFETSIKNPKSLENVKNMLIIMMQSLVMK